TCALPILAFRLERCLPSTVRGPVDRPAFCRFARSRRSGPGSTDPRRGAVDVAVIGFVIDVLPGLAEVDLFAARAVAPEGVDARAADEAVVEAAADGVEVVVVRSAIDVVGSVAAVERVLAVFAVE